MPVKKQDAHRALELLEAYHDRLTSPQDMQLKSAIENVIRIFKSCLFQALLDIQEFYEVTLMNNEKSMHQKMMETLSVATNLEMNSEALAFPIAYEISSASRLANYQSSRSISGLLLPFQSSSSTSSGGGNVDPVPSSSMPPTSPDLSDVSSQQPSVLEQDNSNSNSAPNKNRQFGVGRSTPVISQLLDSNYVYETITLDRGTKGFGFSISGGSNNPHIPGDPSIYVTDILDNHSAALDGRFRINDVIVSVNKISMVNIPHMTAVEVLKNAGNTVTFVIKRKRRQNEQTIRMELTKSSKGLGFSIGGGVGNQHVPGDNGIFVTDIVPDGSSFGKLQVSDRLIYVNGVNLENVSHDKAVMVLKSTQERVTMMIGRMAAEQGQPAACSVPAQMMTHNQAAEAKSTANINMGQRVDSMDLIMQGDPNNKCQTFLAPSLSDPSKDFEFDTSPIYEDALFNAPPSVNVDPSIPRGPRRVILRKGLGELGFNIVGGEDGEGIFVSYILPGGEADLSGEIFRGDQILSVNGVEMFRARHEKAASVLKSAEDVVDLVVFYNPEDYNRFEAKVYELRQQLMRSSSRITLRTTKKKTLFVRALFDYDPSKDKDLPARGLSFCYGDILHVTNASDDEWWQARRIVPGSEDGLGIIPSKSRRVIECLRLPR